MERKTAEKVAADGVSQLREWLEISTGHAAADLDLEADDAPIVQLYYKVDLIIVVGPLVPNACDVVIPR